MKEPKHVEHAIEIDVKIDLSIKLLLIMNLRYIYEENTNDNILAGRLAPAQFINKQNILRQSLSRILQAFKNTFQKRILKQDPFGTEIDADAYFCAFDTSRRE